MYAVISDVHANLNALEAVIKDIRKRGIRLIYFLGDAVGYGPSPNECIDIIRRECQVLLAGNHDWGLCGKTSTLFFNRYAREALEWTSRIITGENLELLMSLPASKNLSEKNITLAHSTPEDPEAWHYMLAPEDAAVSFRFFDVQMCFVGHSHRPVIFEEIGAGRSAVHEKRTPIKEKSRYIVNAGSVGQPRDGDQRASYVSIAENMIEIVRVRYNISATQKKMADAGLPEMLIQRLGRGL